MGNIKIRNLTAATSADITSGNMVPVALDEDAGLERVTRRATFSQIVSGGSGVLAADPNSPFVFNNTTAEQVFKGGLSVPGNITLSGNLNLTGAISGNATGYFDELYISGSAGGWHQITTGWSGSEGGGGGKWIDGAGGDIYYNGGDVGIGTTNPSKKLEIQADAGANTYPFFIKGSNVDQNRIGGILDVHHGTSSIGVLCAFRNDTETEVFLTASGSSYLLGGDFGIGTQTPSARLHVTGGDGTVLAGSGDFTESLTISGNSVLTGSSSALGKWSNSASAGDIYYNVGNVGIGTANPGSMAKFHILGTSQQTDPASSALGNFELLIENDDTTVDNFAKLHLRAGTADSFILGRNKGTNASELAFYTDENPVGSVERMVITSGGNVGIGEASPQAKLHVTGGKILAPSGDFTESLTISGNSVLTGADRPILFDGTNGLNVIEIMNLTAGTLANSSPFDFALTMGTTNTVPDGFGGTKVVDLSAVPVTAKTITVFASIDSSEDEFCSWKYKHPGGSNYVYYIRSQNTAGYPNSNNSTVPLDADGKIDFQFNSSSAFGPIHSLDLHIVGYEA